MASRRGWGGALAAVLGLALPVHAIAQDAAPDSAAGALERVTEQVRTLAADVDRLKTLKLSGYVQARWETGEAKDDSVKASGNPLALTPANNERFYVRRARVKLTYDPGPLSQVVVSIDGGADRAVRLLDAYVTLRDPWTPTRQHQLTIGQMNVPFGYEIERSSSARELPERSRAENVLFPGERDRGVKIVSRWSSRLETVIGVFNGGGVSHPDFPTTDPTRAKDVVARARWSQGPFDAAVSWYDGRNTTPLTGGDVETDKTRIGVDAQAAYALPGLGGGALRGEWYTGEEVNPDSVQALTMGPSASNPVRLLRPGADPAHFASDVSGGYVMWVQHLGERLQSAVRWDRWDPNADADHDQYERLSLGIHWHWDGFTRVTVSYDAIETERPVPGGFADPADNLWTVQVQHRF